MKGEAVFLTVLLGFALAQGRLEAGLYAAPPGLAPALELIAKLVPLGYLPLAGWLAGGPWVDPIWTRLVEHGLCWALLGAGAYLRTRRGTGLPPDNGYNSPGARDAPSRS
mgnify:CR=1 FL=1